MRWLQALGQDRELEMSIFPIGKVACIIESLKPVPSRSVEVMIDSLRNLVARYARAGSRLG